MLMTAALSAAISTTVTVTINTVVVPAVRSCVERLKRPRRTAQGQAEEGGS
ncbi:hypothetical protein [Streptomyces rubiginosohelvolus]|uniref:hypothetical protein n=1 Tax=Streptomyces rubiginosohelvolus TaxID=67362 RepID=UPI0035E32212